MKQVPATQGKLDFHRQEDEETARNAHENAASERDASAGFSYLGTLRQQFALFETPEGLVLMHPKAARERIIFERLRARREAPMPSQQLLDPVVLDLDPRDFAVIRQFAPHFDQAGMVVTPFGQNTIRIESIPALLELENARWSWWTVSPSPNSAEMPNAWLMRPSLGNLPENPPGGSAFPLTGPLPS